jgi:hypothetical protein
MQKSEPFFGVDEIHAIRRQIYEEIKGMTIDEQVTYFNQCGEDIAKEYGLKIVSITNKKNDAQLAPTDIEVIENAKT